MYDGARVPSPRDSSNGLAHPGGSTSRPRPEEGVRSSEPVLVKKAHREILDHERKRRVELKCMELQEMMEEEGYSEEEIKQKVGTFRQMLMEKEGVITRVYSSQHPVVTAHDPEGNRECLPPSVGTVAECGCHVDSRETNSVRHCNHSPLSELKRKYSRSSSPPPKKRKKKKNSRRCDSSSPPRTERKRRSRRKHRRCRSSSASRRKRMDRSGSPKNTNKAKNKQRKKGSHHREASCSSQSPSADRPSPPCRPVCQHGADAHKPSFRCSDCNCNPDASQSQSQSPSRTANTAKAWRNGHQDGGRNSRDRDTDPTRGQKSQDNEPITVCFFPRAALSPRLKDGEVAAGSPVPAGDALSGDGSAGSPSAYPSKGRGQRGTPEKRPYSPAPSSNSLPSHRSQAQRRKDACRKRSKGSHSSGRHRRRRGRAHLQTSSRSPARRGRHADRGRKCLSHDAHQHSSPGSCSRSTSREQHSQTMSPHSRQSQTRSPHSRQNSTREKDSDGRTPHTDTESRAHHRSRSYSPIRKRRSDSPSFMEARRITSARKRPIPYYRPSPSSADSVSSSSAGHRRSGSWSSQSPSRSHSYSRGSSESPPFRLS